MTLRKWLFKTHTALIPFAFFALSKRRTGVMLPKHTEEGFPPSARVSVETRCAVKGEKRARGSRGAEERPEEEEKDN